MNLLRRLFGPLDVQPVDLQRHDEILQDMRNITEKLRTGDPITRMVRGVWRSEPGKPDVLMMETTRETDGDADD